MSSEVEKPLLSEAEARARTDALKRSLEAMWEEAVELYERKVWFSLGYSSWQEYRTSEFDSDHLAVPRSERPQVVAMLREAGMSQRAIAATVNVDQATVGRALKQLDANASPQPRSTTDADPEDQGSGSRAKVQEHTKKSPGLSPREQRTLTRERIQGIADSISWFAGMWSPADCVTLAQALQEPLAKLAAKAESR